MTGFRAVDADEPLPRLRPRELLAALHEHRVEFVVIGGFSLAAHGAPRGTKDIDIVPAPQRANLRRLEDALLALEAAVDLGGLGMDELALPPDADGLAAGGNWVLFTVFGRLDVMQDVPGLRGYDHLRAGAVERDGTLYSGYDELIAMKAASGRPQDLIDLGALRAATSD